MPPPVSVEDFLQAIITGVVQRLGPAIGPLIAQQIQSAPPKVYEVNRVSADGVQRREKVELPQVLAELVDQLKIHGMQMQQQAVAMQQLTKAVDANRKIMKKMLEQANNANDDDDEDDG